MKKVYLSILIISILFLFGGLQEIRAASIALDYPLGGEVWQTGSQKIIRWNCDGINKVLLYLYDDHSTLRVDIADNLDARCPNASYIWTIPASIPNGSTYSVYIIDQPLVSISANSGYITIGAGAGCPSNQIKPHKKCVGTVCKSINSCGVESCVNDIACGGGAPPGTTDTGQSGTIQNPLKYGNFEDLVNAIIGFIYNMALVVAPIMFVISGIMFVTSAGDPEKARTARKVALYTAIGFAVILLSTGLIKVIQSLLQRSS